MTETRPLRVFLCHASQDKPAVRDLYSFLKKQDWIEPWLDETNLLPGMDWDLEIFKALREADSILVCLSKESVAKEGYVQKEFKRALSYAEEKPEGAIYIVPLRLDDCKTPLKFQQWQWADYFTPGAQDKLLLALHMRAASLDILPKGNSIFSKVATLPASQSVGSTPPVSTTSFKNTPGGHTIYTFGDLEFVKIPVGDFYMGADDIDFAEGASKPQHLVYQMNYDFYMARFPVTNRQYLLMARETGTSVIISKGKDEHPVVRVSWYDAQKYVEWLNQKYQVQLPQGLRFCLPSEAEWEKAARGPEGNEYPWGDTFDKDKCNSKENGKNDTTLVGTYSPQGDSYYGCADMVGNVWEYTRSLWGTDSNKPQYKYPYRFDDKREDEDADKSFFRIMRGSSFLNDTKVCRSAFRNKLEPSSFHNAFGFRVAASPK